MEACQRVCLVGELIITPYDVRPLNCEQGNIEYVEKDNIGTYKIKW